MREQHRHYAPGDPVLQDRLNSAARRIAVAYEMYLCSGCGLEWAVPMRAPDAEWYALAYSSMELYPRKRWEYDYVLAATRTEEAVFDIGCGDGAFLRRCRERGVSCRGADFAQEPVQTCVGQGFDVRRIDLENDFFATVKGEADVVTAFQVLEHLSSPRSLFELAASVAAPHGTLWVGVPSNRRPSRVYRERDYLDEPPHHLTRWTERALAAAGKRSGWTLESLVFEPLRPMAALWWISTQSRFYKRYAYRRAEHAQLIERMMRAVHAPVALILRNVRFRSMTGFSMLGRFCRSVPSRGP